MGAETHEEDDLRYDGWGDVLCYLIGERRERSGGVDSAGVVAGCWCVYNEEFRVADYALGLFSGKVSAILSYFIQ